MSNHNNLILKASGINIQDQNETAKSITSMELV
jgi:hypothetical protein